MDRNQKLQTIANGFRAAGRIKNMQTSSFRSSPDASAVPRNADILSEMLKIVVQHSPNTYRGSLGEASDKCDAYCNAYRNLKQHLRSTRQEKLSKDQFVNALRIMEPLVGPQEKLMIQKIMKLYEVFN